MDHLRKEAAALLLKGAETGKLFDPHLEMSSFFLEKAFQASSGLIERVF